MAKSKEAGVVAVVGPGNGIALAWRFADGSYAVALLARDGAASPEIPQIRRQRDR